VRAEHSGGGRTVRNERAQLVRSTARVAGLLVTAEENKDTFEGRGKWTLSTSNNHDTKRA
jgi:hypothetical protein